MSTVIRVKGAKVSTANADSLARRITSKTKQFNKRTKAR